MDSHRLWLIKTDLGLIAYAKCVPNRSQTSVWGRNHKTLQNHGKMFRLQTMSSRQWDTGTHKREILSSISVKPKTFALPKTPFKGKMDRGKRLWANCQRTNLKYTNNSQLKRTQYSNNPTVCGKRYFMYIYTYAWACMCLHIHKQYVHTCTHGFALCTFLCCAYLYVYAHVYTRSYIMHMHVFLCMHIHVHIYIMPYACICHVWKLKDNKNYQPLGKC